MMGCLGSKFRRKKPTERRATYSSEKSARPSGEDQLAPGENRFPYGHVPPFMVVNSNLTSCEVNFHRLKLPTKIPLERREVFLLSKSWRAMHRDKLNIQAVGVEMFVKLFKTNAELQSLFQGFKHIRSDDELRSNEALEYHATLVMTTLDDAITHIDNYEFVRQLLYKTGASHIKFKGFHPQNFMKMKEPFLEAVRVTLGDRYTENMQNIYTIAITFILGTLVEGIQDATNAAAAATAGRNGGSPMS